MVNPWQNLKVYSGECQNPYNHNPYNHNPYCVEILIGFVEILIGLLEILIGLLEILIGQFRDFDFVFFGSFGCRDFDLSVGIMIDGVWAEEFFLDVPNWAPMEL